jgi:hypothetical protein
MASKQFEPREIWVSEHYWPCLATEIVLAQSQRLAKVPGWAGSIVLPAQQTAFGLFVGRTPDDVRAALVVAGVSGGSIDPGWQITGA